MRAFFSFLCGYVVLPLLIGLHIYTQSPAVLYIMGLLSVVMLTIMVLAIATLVLLARDDEAAATLLKDRIPTWKRVVGHVYQAIMFSYFVYIESFFLATIVFLTAGCTVVLFAAINNILEGAKYR